MANRSSVLRDVFIWDLQDTEDRAPLGGLMLAANVTWTDFRQMLDILLIVSADVIVLDDHGNEVLRNNQPLLPGNYLVAADEVLVNNEVVFTRAHSIATGTRVQSFRNSVRERDGRCVITKMENLLAPIGDWTGFEAAHIFPLAYEHHWTEFNFGRWITIDPPEGGGKINSVQNGLLLDNTIHTLFDAYHLSINPDNGYKVIVFVKGRDNLTTEALDRRLLDDPRRPPDSLLRWHFRQAVLSKMRGAGEPVHDFDFPPGSDMMGEILAGPKARERMEFELFDRLAHHTEIV